LQQSLLELQAAPFGAQHCPDSQPSGWQHSALAVHEPPTAPHGAQMPALQMLEQQSLASEQLDPSGLQALHLSSKQFNPWQQGPSAQLSPAAPQAVHT
jgi:hypothetical protein